MGSISQRGRTPRSHSASLRPQNSSCDSRRTRMCPHASLYAAGITSAASRAGNECSRSETRLPLQELHNLALDLRLDCQLFQMTPSRTQISECKALGNALAGMHTLRGASDCSAHYWTLCMRRMLVIGRPAPLNASPQPERLLRFVHLGSTDPVQQLHSLADSKPSARLAWKYCFSPATSLKRASSVICTQAPSKSE